MSSAIVFLFVKWPEITWHTIAPYLHSSVKTVCHTVSLLTLLLDVEKTENSLLSAAHALKSIFWKVGFLFSFFFLPTDCILTFHNGSENYKKCASVWIQQDCKFPDCQNTEPKIYFSFCL